jgi:hypothetical protein
MTSTSAAITTALRENGERASGGVRSFVEDAQARRLSPTGMGYIIYRVERTDRLAPETIRLRPERGSVYYEGESASLPYAEGLPFYVMDGRLWAGGFPPPGVVGEERSLAAIVAAVDLLRDLLTRYLDTGVPATFFPSS